jgi:hypothetical protein
VESFNAAKKSQCKYEKLRPKKSLARRIIHTKIFIVNSQKRAQKMKSCGFKKVFSSQFSPDETESSVT